MWGVSSVGGVKWEVFARRVIGTEVEVEMAVYENSGVGFFDYAMEDSRMGGSPW